ncbi:MAG TPA: zinc ribbon domain-containing protein [Myxococcales bacterium]|nr:zinc ribbon domain-containing protein [Myxococcales bacterium]
MKCPTCGAEPPAGDVFCRRCGSPLSAQPDAATEPVTAATVAQGERKEDPPRAPAAVATPAQEDPAAGRSCQQCGAALAEGVRFCAECGARQPGSVRSASPAPAAGGSAPDPRPASPGREGQPPARPAPASPAPAIATATASTGQSFLLPRIPFRLVWSPRKPWVITTKLSEQEVGRLFSERMTRKANVVRLLNNYYRRVSWSVQRNAISGELVAKCEPDGPVSVGFGERKWNVDVSSNTMVCLVEPSGAGGSVQAAIGAGSYTTLWGLYAYPAPVYAFDVVKAIKQADATSTIKYPWSPARMIMLLAVLILIIVAASSGGSNNSGSYAGSVLQGSGVASSGAGGSSEAQQGTNPGSTETTAPSPATPTPPPLPAASRTIKQHLQDLNDGQYAGAFALMSESYRSSNPGWIANRQTADPSIQIVGVGQPHYTHGGARVYVKFYARDSVATHGSDTRCRIFKGVVYMVDHGGIWRYEPARNALSGKVLSDSTCHA